VAIFGACSSALRSLTRLCSLASTSAIKVSSRLLVSALPMILICASTTLKLLPSPRKVKKSSLQLYLVIISRDLSSPTVNLITERCLHISLSTVMVLETLWDNKLLILSLISSTESSPKSTAFSVSPAWTLPWWSVQRSPLSLWTNVFANDFSSRPKPAQDRPSLITHHKALTLIKASLSRVR